MSTARLARNLEDIARDLDLVVYRLEGDGPAEPDKAKAERTRMRRELERLRMAVEDVARELV